MIIALLTNRWVVLALACAGIYCIGQLHGRGAIYEKWAAENIEAGERAKSIVLKQTVVTDRVITKYVDRLIETQGVATTIEREVTRYVQGDSASCPLPNRWVQLHDASALRAVPPAAGPADDAPSGITAAQALPTVTANNAEHQRTADRLTALQEWVRGQYEAVNGVKLE